MTKQKSLFEFPVEKSKPCSLKYQLIKANALNLNSLRPKSVDLIVTSPPYNVGKSYGTNAMDDSIAYNPHYLNFTRKWLANCYQWAKNTARICINVSLDKNKFGKQPLSADVTKIAIEEGWKYHATIVWNEGNISRRTAWGSWKSASAPHIIAPVETIIVLYKNQWKRENPGQSDITAEEFKNWVLGTWTFNGESGKRIGHPAPFPRELPKRCIKLFSFKNDIVLDPFVGSGTTMIEAIQNGRQVIGLEKEKEYCHLTLNRLETECGLKLNTWLKKRQGKSVNPCWQISITQKSPPNLLNAYMKNTKKQSMPTIAP